MTREEAIDILSIDRLAYNEADADKFCEAYNMAISALKDAKSGQWVEHQKYFTCNHCESQIAKEYFSNFNFCPWCGADMRGEKNEYTNS